MIIPGVGPIRIIKTTKCNVRSFDKVKTNVKSTFEVLKYTLNNNDMRVTRMVHKLADIMDYIRDIGACQGEILK